MITQIHLNGETQMDKETKEKIWQKEYELDDFSFTIEALEFKIKQIKRSIEIGMPLKNALDDLYKNERALKMQKTIVAQIKIGLKELNKRSKNG